MGSSRDLMTRDGREGTRGPLTSRRPVQREGTVWPLEVCVRVRRGDSGAGHSCPQGAWRLEIIPQIQHAGSHGIGWHNLYVPHF